VPPAVALLNYISSGLLWRIFFPKWDFRGVFSAYHRKKIFPADGSHVEKTADEFTRHLCALVLLLKGQWDENLIYATELYLISVRIFPRIKILHIPTL
jgi:hypothetical protein